jgi:hypothetical protein
LNLHVNVGGCRFVSQLKTNKIKGLKLLVFLFELTFFI